MENTRRRILKSWYNDEELIEYERCLDKRDWEGLKKLHNEKKEICGKRWNECPACQILRLRKQYGYDTDKFYIDSVTYNVDETVEIVIKDERDDDFKQVAKLDGNKLIRLLNKNKK